MTSTIISHLDALAKKVESFIQNLQCARIQPSKTQYQTLETLSLKLSKATASVPVEIEALKRRHLESFCEEGRKLVTQAQLEFRDVTIATKLRSPLVFARNIKLFFKSPQDSAIDSDTIKGRKRLTRERCERICSLRPDGLITWAVAFAPSKWTASLMSNRTFDYVVEHIVSEDLLMWPSEIYDMLGVLGDEEPLRDSAKYLMFLKATQDSMKILSSSKQQKKRKHIEDEPTRETIQISAGQIGDLAVGEMQTGRPETEPIAPTGPPSLTGDVYELTAEDARIVAVSNQIPGQIWLTDTYEANYTSFVTIPVSNKLTSRFIIQRPRVM